MRMVGWKFCVRNVGFDNAFFLVDWVGLSGNGRRDVACNVSTIHACNVSTIHPQTNFTIHPQTNFTIHPQTNFTIHPQTNFTIHPQTNFTIHPNNPLLPTIFGRQHPSTNYSTINPIKTQIIEPRFY
jgi:hypothetical protein